MSVLKHLPSDRCGATLGAAAGRVAGSTGKSLFRRAAGLAALVLLSAAAGWGMAAEADEEGAAETPVAAYQPGRINCANLIYGDGKTSRCFSAGFLTQAGVDATIDANSQFVPIALDSPELFRYPFAVMTGEGKFAFTEQQRGNMRSYLENGGFIVASAGCSSDAWQASFLSEMEKVFPDIRLTALAPSHPIFHTVYDISELSTKRSRNAQLSGLEIDGKIVLIFSPDGLNDTANAGGNCCCCGGDEILNARQMNLNLLAYTLTH